MKVMALLPAICILWLAPATAQTPATPPASGPVQPPATAPARAPAEAATPAPAVPADSLGRETPRGAAVGYLQAVRDGELERAAQYLNLSRLPEGRRAAQGPTLARHLKQVLDRVLWVEPEALSGEPSGHTDDGLPAHLDRIGTIDTSRGRVEVLLERVPGEGGPIWQVAAATVAQVPALHAEFGPGLLANVLPEPLVRIRVLEVALWQWIGLVVLLVVAAAASWLVAFVVARAVRPVVARLSPTLGERLVGAEMGPLRLAVGLVLFSAGSLVLRLSVPAQEVITALTRLALILAVAWLLTRLTGLFAQRAVERLLANGRSSAIGVVPLARKTVVALIAVLALLAGLHEFGVNVTAVVAGLGIGGLAVALAAQKTVENLFGGVTLILNQPVRVGDFCRFGSRVGIIEEIGLRSTRVRTLDRTVVTVPNATFSGLELENFALRDRIWFSTKLGLRSETTADQIRWVLVEIRRLLYSHERVIPDPARIRFVGFGDYSLDLEIFAYVATTDFGEFLAIREELYLSIMDIVAQSGTGFAFPSQTLYVGPDPGLDAKRSREAEARVREWREGQELLMPEFPRERVEALRGSVPYPPKGSALAAAAGRRA